MVSSVRRGLGVVVLALVTGCVVDAPPAHSANHHHCRRTCTQSHDACVVASADAAALQRCDSELRGCLANCPY